MILKIYNNKNITTIDEPTKIIAILLNLFYEINVTKESTVKNIASSYNYPFTNITITFKDCDLKHEYINIPSDNHSLDIYKIQKILEENNKEVKII